MKKYYITGDYAINSGFWSESRNAKKHLQDNGGTYVVVHDIHGKAISAAKYSDGTVINTLPVEDDDMTANELIAALQIR